jgi:hypothetical protein
MLSIIRATGRNRKKEDPFLQPGPHGYPMRFAVRLAGPKGFKIYGADPGEPIHYIECHSRHQVLHETGHKKDKSPAQVSIHSNWPSWSIRPVDTDVPAFTITVHNNDTTTNPSQDNANADNASNEANDDQTINLEHTRCRPVTFQFQLPIPTSTTTDATTDTTTPPPVETFEWRRAPHACHETRSIRKRTLPLTETGDERPPEERFVYAPSGSILVRLNSPNKRASLTSSVVTTTPGTGTDRDQNRQPVGFTNEGEEIVASYTNSRDYRAWYYFQFWGSGATGELGEVFTRVAVMSGLAVWQDEEDELGRRKRGKMGLLRDDGLREMHGLAPVLASGMPRRPENEGVSAKLGVHVVQHGTHPPGHLAVQCGVN